MLYSKVSQTLQQKDVKISINKKEFLKEWSELCSSLTFRVHYCTSIHLTAPCPKPSSHFKIISLEDNFTDFSFYSLKWQSFELHSSFTHQDPFTELCFSFVLSRSLSLSFKYFYCYNTIMISICKELLSSERLMRRIFL